MRSGTATCKTACKSWQVHAATTHREARPVRCAHGRCGGAGCTGLVVLAGTVPLPCCGPAAGGTALDVGRGGGAACGRASGTGGAGTFGIGGGSGTLMSGITNFAIRAALYVVFGFATTRHEKVTLAVP